MVGERTWPTMVCAAGSDIDAILYISLSSLLSVALVLH